MRIDVPERRRPGIRLTPLIDVVFILLVFFMLASSFLEWRSFDLALPSGDATPAPDVSPIVIDLDRDGPIRVDGNELESDDLVARVRQLRADAPERPVVVRARDTTPVQVTVRTLDRLSAGGIDQVSLAAGAP